MVISYNKDPSKMRSLSEKEGYAKYFKVVPAKMVGGSEANYMIGEMVTPEDTGKLLILELFLELLPR
jgi:hypothetical protein